MADNALNTGELARALKLSPPNALDVLLSMQPGVNVSDLSHLVPPIPVPVGGFSVALAAGGAGVFNQAQVTSAAPGGFVVLIGELDASDLVYFWCPATDQLPAGAAVAVVGLAGDLTPASSVKTATGASIKPATAPFSRGVALNSLDGLWVAPGRYLVMESEDNKALDLSLTFQEIPAAPSP